MEVSSEYILKLKKEMESECMRMFGLIPTTNTTTSTTTPTTNTTSSPSSAANSDHDNGSSTTDTKTTTTTTNTTGTTARLDVRVRSCLDDLTETSNTFKNLLKVYSIHTSYLLLIIIIMTQFRVIWNKHLHWSLPNSNQCLICLRKPVIISAN